MARSLREHPIQVQSLDMLGYIASQRLSKNFHFFGDMRERGDDRNRDFMVMWGVGDAYRVSCLDICELFQSQRAVADQL
jgi:hypothetical protein